MHSIGLILDNPFPERLERGLYPEVPCALYITASNAKIRMYNERFIFEALPFNQLKEFLAAYLREAGAELDRCTAEFIAMRGKPYPES
jgi:hypothetical protein